MRIVPVLGFLIFSLCLVADKARSSENPATACVKRVMAADAVLGAARNHETEQRGLAGVVRDYAEAIEALSFDDCPPRFRQAFMAHASAWRDSAGFFQIFDKERGELHALFERIRADPRGAELATHETAIWDTWAEVEAAKQSATDESASTDR